MSDFDSVLIAGYEMEARFRDRDLAQAYIAATTEHGPSASLLAFVNHDMTMGKQLGLESFETFTAGTQHEILLSTLNLEQLDTIALEGFVDWCVKYRRWLLVASFIVPMAWVGAIVGYTNRKGKEEISTLPMSYFQKRAGTFKTINGELEKLVRALPTGFTESTWSDFKADASEASDKTDVIPKATEPTAVGVTKSGWTPQTFSKEARWLKTAGDEFMKLRKESSKKIEAIEHFAETHQSPKDTKLIRDISTSMKQLSEIFRKAMAELKELNTVLHGASAGFEFDEK